MIMCHVNELKRLSKTFCKNAAPPQLEPLTPQGLQTLQHQAGPPDS